VASRRPHRSARVLLAVCAAALMVAAFGPSAGHAEPTTSLAEVQREVNALHRQAEEATERYNAERIRLRQHQKKVASLQASADAQQARVAAAQKVLGEYADASFRSGGIDPALELLFAEDPEYYLHSSGLLDRMANRQVAALERVVGERRKLEQRKAGLDKELAKLAKSHRRLLDGKRDIEAKINKAEELLASLEADQRAEIAPKPAPASSGQSQSYTGPASGDVKKVLDYA